MSLVIAHAGGSTTVSAYTVPLHRAEIARRVTRGAGGAVRVLGDRLPRPRSLQVDAWVPAASQADAYAAAFDLVDDATTATAVTWHFGTFAVAALASYRINAEANGATVALAFLLAAGDPNPALYTSLDFSHATNGQYLTLVT